MEQTQPVQAAGVLPASPETIAAFTESYRLEGEKQFAASQQSIQAFARQGDSFALMREAWLAYQMGNYRLSAARYEALLASQPDLVEARLGLMLPLMAQRRWQDAAAQARLVLARYPGQYTAEVRLLRCLEAMKQWDAVEQQASRLAAIYPSEADILIGLARARAGKRQVAAARDAYAVVLTRNPQNEEAQLYLKANP
jgi:tetratricopeptide (TPR) repeat protein